jgi:hypothetical protein
VVFRDKYPFYMFIKSKLGKYRIEIRVTADTKYFYAYNMQVYTDKTDGAREKKQGLSAVKDVCHINGTGRGNKGKGKVTRYRPVWPRGWVEVQLYSSKTSALEGGEWSAACPSHTLPSGYPLYRRLDGPQGRSGQVWKISPPTGTQSPNRPARSHRKRLYH